MSTLQAVIKDRLQTHAPLTADPPAGMGFKVFDKWLRETGPGAEPTQYNPSGALKPSIVVWPQNENRHPGPVVPGLRKWDTMPLIYLFHYPGVAGKETLDAAKLLIEQRLTDPTWKPVITGGQRPVIDANEPHQVIDDPEQFPGNYVYVLQFRVTGVRTLW
jgi:hypothetical protein